MNILLLNPPAENVIKEFQDREGKGFLEAADYGKFPPLGLLYVLAYAQQQLPHHAYFFVDCVAEGISYEELSVRLKQIKPDVVGLTSFTIALLDIVKTAQIVRKATPGAHVCLGGHHPTSFPVESARLPYFDSIVAGEGEFAFTALLQRLEAGDEYGDIVGLYTRETIDLHRNPEYRDSRFRNRLVVPPAYIENIDVLPPPDRRCIAHINYNSIIGLKSRLATIITSRGCPCHCTFCDVPYKQYRPRSVNLIMDEIEQCVAMGYEEFHFYDDLFNITHTRILDFCDALEERGLSIVWDFRGRVNGVTFESLQRAQSLGLRMISFGVETGSDEGLRMLRKGCTVAQIKQAFQWCRSLGIKTVADFMIGLPSERTPRDVRNNIAFLMRLKPDYAQIGILNLYPHTQLFDDAAAKGLIEAQRWEKWAIDPVPGFTVDHWTEFLPWQTLVKLHRESYRRFYFRPAYIVGSLVRIRSFHEFKSKLMGALILFFR